MPSPDHDSKTNRMQELNGVFWDQCEIPYGISSPIDREKCCLFLLENLAPYTWNTLRSFENCPATLAQTASILAGHSVSGLSNLDLLQIKNYGDGTKALAGLIQEDKFELSAPTACHLHNYVGKEDALEWGVIRSKDVSLHNISFVPPTNDLEKIIQNGFNFLQHEVANPVERAIGVFLFMARNQPFYDANERTASLMMNGCLMVNGYFPITVLNQNSEEFHRELGLFYESGNANDMFRFFQKTIQELYSKEQYESFSANNK